MKTKRLPTDTWLVHPSRSMADLFKIVGVTADLFQQEFEVEAASRPKTVWLDRRTVRDMRPATSDELAYGQWIEGGYFHDAD